MIPLIIIFPIEWIITGNKNNDPLVYRCLDYFFNNIK